MREMNKSICIVLHVVLNSVSSHVHEVRNPRQSWTLDSTSWIPDSSYWILVLFQDSSHSNRQQDSGFLQLYSGFHKQTFSRFRIPHAKISRIPESLMGRSVSNAKARIQACLRNSRDFASQILSLTDFRAKESRH